MADVKLWRYSLPSIKGSGWAIFVLGSDGYFSSISDFGNYAYLWAHHGKKDFREFLLDVENHWDYFVNKLSPGREYDGEATKKAIHTRLHEMMENGEITIAEVEEEAELLELEYDIEDSVEAFHQWASKQEKIDEYEAHALYEEKHPYMVERFVKEAMVRLVPLLKKDLECSTSSTEKKGG